MAKQILMICVDMICGGIYAYDVAHLSLSPDDDEAEEERNSEQQFKKSFAAYKSLLDTFSLFSTGYYIFPSAIIAGRQVVAETLPSRLPDDEWATTSVLLYSKTYRGAPKKASGLKLVLQLTGLLSASWHAYFRWCGNTRLVQSLSLGSGGIH